MVLSVVLISTICDIGLDPTFKMGAIANDAILLAQSSISAKRTCHYDVNYRLVLLISN
jgi:hypothetical protein